MKKVQMYQSTDGKLHETEEQCREHEQKVNLRQWYEGGNELMGIYAGSRVQYDDLVEWLVCNQAEAQEIIRLYAMKIKASEQRDAITDGYDQLKADMETMKAALESILLGSLLDVWGNRDDDGINSAISMGIQRDSLQRWRKIALQALAPHRDGGDL